MRSNWRSKRRSDATAGERSLAGHLRTLGRACQVRFEWRLLLTQPTFTR